MMLRADKVIAAGQWSGAPADTVVLDFDDRYRRRLAMTGVGGLAFLPETAHSYEGGIKTDLLEYTVDRSPVKQGKFLPGTRIPIYAPDRLAQTQPDYVLVLPWNLRDEISRQLAYVRDWGGRLVFPIPALEVV